MQSKTERSGGAADQATRTAATVVDTSRSPFVRLRPVPLGAVTLADTFWAPRRHTNASATLPSQYRHLEDTDRFNNFRRAAGDLDAPFVGLYFNDSDVYKWLEAAAWTLAEGPNPELEGMIDAAIAVVAARRPAAAAQSACPTERQCRRHHEHRWSSHRPIVSGDGLHPQATCVFLWPMLPQPDWPLA